VGCAETNVEVRQMEGMQDTRDDRKRVKAARKAAAAQERRRELEQAEVAKALPVEDLLERGASSSPLIGSLLFSDIVVARAEASSELGYISPGDRGHKAFLYNIPPVREAITRGDGIVVLPLREGAYELALRRGYGWSFVRHERLGEFSLLAMLDACEQIAAWGWMLLAGELWTRVNYVLYSPRDPYIRARAISLALRMSFPLRAIHADVEARCALLLDGEELCFTLTAAQASVFTRKMLSLGQIRTCYEKIRIACLRGRDAWLADAVSRVPRRSPEEVTLVAAWQPQEACFIEASSEVPKGAY
jgi:hypothetical protein